MKVIEWKDVKIKNTNNRAREITDAYSVTYILAVQTMLITYAQDNHKRISQVEKPLVDN